MELNPLGVPLRYTVKVPLALAAIAPALSKSQSVPAVPAAFEMSTFIAPPAFKVSAPQARAARAPAELPGSTVPLTVRFPTGPSPISVAPEATVTAEFASEPLTSSVPALTVVLPLIPLTPDSVNVPAPFFVSVPVPLITPAYVTLSDRFQTKAALFTMSAVTEPDVPPLPICTVPALLVILPENVFAPVSSNVPAPVLPKPPLPEIAAGYVSV